MSNKHLNVDDFISLMKENWPTAFQSLYPLFPRIRRIEEHINADKASIMACYGLYSSDFDLLTALRRSNKAAPYELMPTEICEYMLFSSGGLTKVMNRLEKKAFITRVESNHDKRIKMVRLTVEGEQLIEEVVEQFQDLHTTYLDGFKQEDVEQLDFLVRKLLNNIELKK
ncbi:MarR family transcriptional regulator [Vibrio sp. DW001]|uniref:MarR family winged helix-turn-helix transcriptional regulator n=1 Tax=Vibrio sp. DW001 TaxID=2912315 RepID=UPI0023B08029|nr:MarR family transcriptional regulator [Vibrio sp. DW001]WED28948.1 MarR family transcriptional regulator [Vibrio sp. DW001]